MISSKVLKLILILSTLKIQGNLVHIVAQIIFSVVYIQFSICALVVKVELTLNVLNLFLNLPTSRFILCGICFKSRDKYIQFFVHRHSVDMDWFPQSKIFSPVQPQSSIWNPLMCFCFLFSCPCISVLFRMSYKWTHTLYSLLSFPSLTQRNEFESINSFYFYC